MIKEPGMISNLLNFLSKMLEKIEDYDKKRRQENDKIREIFGEMLGTLNQDNIFYLVKCQGFDGKSLLNYINSQNVRLLRQREELIDLSVKIANLTHRGNPEKAMDNVIKNYKSGLESGVGLRDMIDMIKERYPWSSTKMKIMIFVSLMTCALGIGLYVFDLTTDIRFSLEMYYLKAKGSFPEDPTYASIFQNITHPGPKECWQAFETAFETCWDQHYVDPEKNFTLIEYDDMKTTGGIAVLHCIQPFLGIFIVFLTMNYNKIKCSLPQMFVPDCLKRWCCIPLKVLWILGYLLCFLASLIPLPVFTHIYRFCLYVRFYDARRKLEFRKKIMQIESEIQKYEALGKYWKDQKINFRFFKDNL